MKERVLESLKNLNSKRKALNETANRTLSRDGYMQGQRENPEFMFSFTGGLEELFIFRTVASAVNFGMGVWTLALDMQIQETASYIADLTGGRKVKRPSIKEDLIYYKEVAKVGKDTLFGKVQPIIWGLS